MNTTDLSLEDPYAVEQQAIQRRMQLANLLMQKGASDAPVYSNKAGAMKLLAGLLSGVQMREAEGQQKELAGRKQEADRGEMESIIAASQGQDPKAVMKQLLASSNPQHRQMALAMALKGPGKVEWKDAGDKLVAVDETGKPTGQTMPKSVTPDARFGKETVSADKVYDKTTVDANTRFGKETVGAEAKLTDERTRKEGAANRSVSLLGQERTDARAAQSLAQNAYDRVEDAQGNLNYVPKAPGGEPVPIEGVKGKGRQPSETYLKQQAGVENVRRALTDYRDALKKFGTTDIVSPNARAEMGTFYNNALLQAKEAYNLGVLNGPDYSILQQTLTDPASLRGGITSKAAMDKQAQNLDSLMKKIGEGSARAHGQPQPNKVDTKEQYDLLPKGSRYIAPDGSERIKG